MSRIALPTKESSGTALLRQRTPHSSLGSKGFPLGSLTAVTTTREKGYLDLLSRRAGVQQPQPCGVLTGPGTAEPLLRPALGHAQTPNVGLGPGLQPLPHSLGVPGEDFLLTVPSSALWAHL